MSTQFHEWLEQLRAKRERWVSASHENNFDRGIWNATVDKYADPSHFIFELLQNAEDAEASWVRFRLEPDRILFEHNGRPFDRDDIEGITGIGNTTKLDDGHKIGSFGIGFKSVYVVTDRPEVHSLIEGEPLAFAIESLVVPKLIASDNSVAATQIILPLRPDRADNTLETARAGLTASGARALLFLRHVKRLEWIDGESRGRAEVHDSEGSIRSIRSTLPDGTIQQDRFLILARAVEQQADRKQYEVKAALRMNHGGDLIAEETPMRLMVFFETEEATGLHFAVHGPFQLTDNRGNIKRDDPWNQHLVSTIGEMIADALPDFRERGLLKRGVLDLLPNGSDELPPAFAPIRVAVTAKFIEDALIPAHGGGFATARTAIRAPSDLRDLLGESGLAEFGAKPGRRWITSGLRNSRAEAFLVSLKIEEWGFAEFFSAFLHVFGRTTVYVKSDTDWRKGGLAWFNQLSDEQYQHFYLALDSAHKAQRRPTSISDLMFVRLDDGRRTSPQHAVFAPDDSGIEGRSEQNDLYLVKKSLIRLGRGRGKDVEQFLRRVGVRDIDERAYLGALIRSEYKGEGSGPNRERHLQHMRRFIRWWKETEDTSMFAGVDFVRAGEEAAYHDPDDVYFGEAFLESGLSKINGSAIAGRERAALWEGYKGLPHKDLVAFLEECGVEAGLIVLSSTIPYGHPHWSELKYGFGNARHTGTGVDIDYRIDQLPELLALGDSATSRMVWDAVRAAGANAMVARFSPNQAHASHQRPSTLAIALRDVAWIPAKDGGLRRPKSITTGELAKGFTVGGNEEWLRAIGFGEDQQQRSEQHKARRKAGELIGLAPDLVDQLGGLPPETLAAINADIMQKIASRSYEPVEFPQRVAGNPTRRAERLAARTESSPAKAYEVRERSVRTSNIQSRALARTYLEDHYTTPLGEMVCQGCHKQMPFSLPDGTPYFEAVECLDSLEKEQEENHLAMCPTCAAKWRHANGIQDADLRGRLSAASEPEIIVELAGEPVLLRFTQVHLDDLRTVGGFSPS
jgi:hypothetical protein